MFVVNAPMLFAGVWAVCKSFLDEKTRNKIKIVGSKFQPLLLEHVEAEDLPEFLGGKCTCSDFEGGCMRSNVGPWNLYEITEPKGIKLKSNEIEEVPVQKEETKEEEEVAQLEEQVQNLDLNKEEKPAIQEEITESPQTQDVENPSDQQKEESEKSKGEELPA